MYSIDSKKKGIALAQRGETHYDAQLGHLEKCCLFKGLVVCNS